MTVLFFSAFLLNTGLTVALLGVTFYLIARFQATLFQLGLLSGIGAFVFMVGALSCGKFLSARTPAKVLTLFGVSLFILTFLILPHLPSLGSVYLIYPIGSLGMGLFWPSLERWISSANDASSLKRSIGLFNLSWSPGQILGPFLAGFLHEKGVFLPIWFGISLAIPVLPLLSFAQERKKTHSSSDQGKPLGKPPPFLIFCWLTNFSSWVAMSIFRSLFPKYGLSLGLTPTTIGLFLLLIGTGQVLFFWILSRREGWEKRPRFFLGWEGVAFLAVLAVAFGYHPLLWTFAFFLFGCFAGVAYSGSILLSLKDSQRAGRYAGFHETIIGLGLCLGPFVGGIAGNVFGGNAPYFVSAALLGSVMLVQLWLIWS